MPIESVNRARYAWRVRPVGVRRKGRVVGARVAARFQCATTSLGAREVVARMTQCSDSITTAEIRAGTADA
jgi:hypothetical protein